MLWEWWLLDRDLKIIRIATIVFAVFGAAVILYTQTGGFSGEPPDDQPLTNLASLGMVLVVVGGYIFMRWYVTGGGIELKNPHTEKKRKAEAEAAAVAEFAPYEGDDEGEVFENERE